MASPTPKPRRQRRKRTDEWSPEKPRHLGVESAILWAVTLGFWGRTAVWFYNERILGRHDAMYAAVLVIDLLLPVLAILLTVEWWRGRRRRRP